MLAHGTYFTGLVKNAKGFQKKFLNDVGWSLIAQRGDTITTCHAFVMNLKVRKIYGHTVMYAK